MDLTHRFTVPTGVESTWAHFQDIAALAECFPGASVTSVEDDRFSGSCKVKLGPIALLYTGSGVFTEKDDAAHRFVVDAKGKDKRGNGTAGAKVTLSMSETAGATEVEVVTDLSITGKPAQFGRGVMQDVSDKLLGQFVACLQQRLEAGSDSQPDPGGADPDAGPGSTPTGAAAAGPGVPGVVDADPDSGPASAPDAARSAGPAPAGAPAPAGEGPGAGSGTGPGSAGTGWGPVGGSSEDALDLGSAIWPVLLRSYGKPAAAVLGVLLVLLWWRRRG